MKVFMVVINIDLGYHVVKVFTNKEEAERLCVALNKEYKNHYTGRTSPAYTIEPSDLVIKLDVKNMVQEEFKAEIEKKKWLEENGEPKLDELYAELDALYIPE